MSNLISRWRELCSILQAQRDYAPEPTVVSTRQLLLSLYNEAQASCVALPIPAFDDKVFDTMLELVPDTKVSEEHAAEIKSRIGKQTYQDRIKNKIWHPCFCGCNQPTQKRFVKGHHARWVGMMRRVERGELRRESLPAIILTNTEWKLCIKCSGFMPTKDADDSLTGRYGFDCLVTRKHVPDPDDIFARGTSNKFHRRIRVRGIGMPTKLPEIILGSVDMQKCPQCGSSNTGRIAGKPKTGTQRRGCMDCKVHYFIDRITGTWEAITYEPRDV